MERGGKRACHRHAAGVVSLGHGQIYVRKQNVVYDPVTGAVVWRGPAGSVGHAVAGDHVVYTVGTRLVIERFR